MKKNLLSLILISCVLQATTVVSQTLSLDACIEMALKNNPGLQASQARADAAQANAVYARRQKLADIFTRLSYTRLSDADPFAVDTPFGHLEISSPILDTYSANASAQQPLFTGFRLSHNAQRADNVAQATEFQVVADLADLALEVTRAYYQLALAGLQRESLQKSIVALESHLADVQNFEKGGLATRNDALQAEVMLSNARIQLNQIESQQYIAQKRLDLLIKAPQPVSISDDISIKSNPNPDLKTLLDLANQNRPELKALSAQAAAADHGVGVAKSGYYPNLFAVASLNYAQPNQRYQPLKEEFHTDWALGLAAQWTPFDWGRTSQQVAAARANERQANWQLQQLQDRVQLEVMDAFSKVTETSSRLDLVATTVSRAEENLRVARDLYKAGMTKNSDVLDAESSLLQAELVRSQTQIEHAIAIAALNRAVGKRVE